MGSQLLIVGAASKAIRIVCQSIAATPSDSARRAAGGAPPKTHWQCVSCAAAAGGAARASSGQICDGVASLHRPL